MAFFIWFVIVGKEQNLNLLPMALELIERAAQKWNIKSHCFLNFYILFSPSTSGIVAQFLVSVILPLVSVVCT